MEYREQYMDPNKTKRAYSPFLTQAINDSLLYACILLVGMCVLVAVDRSNDRQNLKLIIVLFQVYMVWVLWHFRLPILSIVERKKNLYCKDIFNVSYINMDGWCGSYKNDNERIKYYFPDELDVERIKLLCKDNAGKKVKLRIVTSGRKRKTMTKYFELRKERVIFTYGKYTKIIVDMEYPNPSDKIKYNAIKLLSRQF